ncbi:hypothetical protein FIBSPDRAFT_866364 [Athelia psychrophila]|uniref:Uncharacterized protein n=1 Tax=Athelia psychrophila TaxID=1759441 RepID=A0A166EUP7_9AGAM|nr:hypothetical protein FIBSPDRAFT_866364 [Fibularhizoctonia sp. CBS 109695]
MNRRLSERTAQTHLSNPRSVGSFPPVAEDVPVGYNNNATSSTGHSPSANDESYASHYQPGYQGKPQPAVPAEDPFRRNTMQAQQASPGGGMPNPYGDSDGEEGEDPYAYDGYADEHHPEARASLEDDGFYGATPRVLKVANE